MKFTITIIGVFALLVAAFSHPNGPSINAAQVEQRIFEDKINSTINSLIAKAKMFDPFYVIHKTENVLGHQVEVNTAKAEGFSNLYASHIRLAGFFTWTLDLVIEAPKSIAYVEKWKIDGDLVTGNGNGSVAITNFKAVTKAKIGLDKQIKELQVTPSVENIKIFMSGELNGETFDRTLNEKLSVLLTDFINNNKNLHKKLSELARKFLQKLIDSQFGGRKLSN